MPDTYKTIDKTFEGLYKEKGSKFIARLYHVEHLDQVKELVECVRAEFFDARHVCYGYRIGYNGDVWRAVDDREPSGTAGKPIHGQLLNADVTNVLGVVVRYFGGVKLGVGGLIVAYKTAILDAIENAHRGGGIIEKTIDIKVQISCQYAHMSLVMGVLKGYQCNVESQGYDNKSNIVIVIRKGQLEKLQTQLDQLRYMGIEHFLI